MEIFLSNQALHGACDFHQVGIFHDGPYDNRSCLAECNWCRLMHVPQKKLGAADVIVSHIDFISRSFLHSLPTNHCLFKLE